MERIVGYPVIYASYYKAWILRSVMYHYAYSIKCRMVYRVFRYLWFSVAVVSPVSSCGLAIKNTNCVNSNFTIT